MTSDMCRICLEQEFLTSIFQKQGSVRISTKVVSLANVTISPSDGLPSKICSVCIKRLDDCTDFINLCQDSDTKLRTKLYKNSDYEPQTCLDIEFENGNYSLGIEDEHFADCNLITDNDSDNQMFSIPEDSSLEKKNKGNGSKEEKKSRKIKGNKGNGFKEKKSGKISLKGDEISYNDKKIMVKQQCSTCGKVLSSRFRLKTHLRTHTGERPFSCPHCNKNFTVEQNLKVHMRVHTGEKPLQCSVCGESFAQTAGLATHVRKHTGQTPYHCVLCPRSFRTNGHLQYHVRRHTGEKNFECDTCNKAFITRSGLKQHLLTHTGDKLYVCTVCGKRMTRASHVKRHVQQAHREMLVCNKCPSKFTHKADFDKHKLTHEGEKT